MGPDTKAAGESKKEGQYFQKQFAQTIARLMGYEFKADQPIAEAIDPLFRK